MEGEVVVWLCRGYHSEVFDFFLRFHGEADTYPSAIATVAAHSTVIQSCFRFFLNPIAACVPAYSSCSKQNTLAKKYITI